MNLPKLADKMTDCELCYTRLYPAIFIVKVSGKDTYICEACYEALKEE